MRIGRPVESSPCPNSVTVATVPWQSEMEAAHAIITAKLPKRTRDVLAMPPGERKRVIEERKAPLARREPKKS
jgi:hypothetical protein